jgi:hypothetical protein
MSLHSSIYALLSPFSAYCLTPMSYFSAVSLFVTERKDDGEQTVDIDGCDRGLVNSAVGHSLTAAATSGRETKVGS